VKTPKITAVAMKAGEPVRIFAGKKLAAVISATRQDIAIRTEPGYQLESASLTITITRRPAKRPAKGKV